MLGGILSSLIYYMYRLFFVAIAAGLPNLTSAHTRWFAEGDLQSLQTTEPTALYLGIWAVICILVVGVGIYLHQKNILRLAFLRPKGARAYERAASTFTMIVGAFLLIAATHEYLFSPNLTPDAGVPMVLILLQIIVGLSFLLGIGSRLGAILIGVVWIGASSFVGIVATLENIWVLSTAIFIATVGNDYFSLFSFSYLKDKLKCYAGYGLSFLRIGTGATLIVLGFSEKILAPEYGVNFLQQHDWNFMAALGFNYSDYLFTLSAGSVEFLFGLVFFLGILTRLNALVVAIVFSVPLFLLGPIELSGHLPHFAAVVLLLLFGNGGHLPFFKTYDDSKVTCAKT